MGNTLNLPSESGLYIHFPFCRRRCHYCDFNTYAVPEIPTDAYTNAILKELDERAHLLDGTQLKTVFLGGGTPGLWGPGPGGIWRWGASPHLLWFGGTVGAHGHTEYRAEWGQYQLRSEGNIYSV